MAKKPTVERVEVADEDIEIISNTAGAETIFIDGAQGILFGQSVVRVNLYQIIQEFAGTPKEPSVHKKMVVARLVMTPQTALSMANWLASNVTDFLRQEAEFAENQRESPDDK
ncbi:MAG: hypothetical protein RIM84_26100 [Alphaproteobacteria bacterium]